MFLTVCSEKVRFSLKGAQHREKRFRIYRFLLEHFTDAQRFNISNKISQTVLGEHVFGLGNKTKSRNYLLNVSLSLMTCIYEFWTVRKQQFGPRLVITGKKKSLIISYLFLSQHAL